jgi:hypothetical protein
MINYSEVISQIEDQHCGSCKHGLAKRALLQLVETVPIPVKPEQTMPEPKKAVKVHRQPRMVVKGRTEKACNRCHVIKPVSAYPKNRTCADGHAGTCSACTQERAKRNYLAAQARKRGSTVLDKVAADTKALAAPRCQICHCNFISQAKLDEHNEMRHGG